MKILAIYSSKGGVGKTATSVNLAYTALKTQKRVLLCDMDSQGAASYYFRIKPKKKFNRSRLLRGDYVQFIRGTDYPGLDLLPAHFSFRNLDIALTRGQGEQNRQILHNLLKPLKRQYDFIVLDCPPNLTLLSENILTAADCVITPVVPTTLSVLALQQLLKLSKKLECEKGKILSFFSMVERRKTMHKEIMGKYRKYPLFMSNYIPYSAEIEKMGVHRKPVGANNRGTTPVILAYQNLWEEIVERRLSI